MIANNQNSIETRKVAELLALKFSIPSYQRGYRWDKAQVLALLNDVHEYVIDYQNEDAFYCLQPVVVAENANGEFELIDGQQRLTTILLILRYLNDTEFKTPKPIYGISFESRSQQQNFVEVVHDSAKCKDDIDLFHLNVAYVEIKHWFENLLLKNPSIGGDFYGKLINKVRFIWYEIKDGSNVIDIFTRLNIGKIPLTNAELIKALFLTKTNFLEQASQKQVQIATEWDSIEKKLQDDSFWYFIYSPINSAVSYENRIEYLFDLIQKKGKDEEEYFTFYQFNKQIKEDANPDIHWQKIKEYFLTLEEWYTNHELYHLIGFLIENDVEINVLRDQSKQLLKNEFYLYLRKVISDKLGKIDLSQLSYTEDKNKIRMVLLLFNLETILHTHKATVRFPFDKYKDENWHLEHVTSQTDKRITDELAWSKDILFLLLGINAFDDEFPTEDEEKTNKEIAIEKVEKLANAAEKQIASQIIKLLQADKLDKELFAVIYDEVIHHYGENDIIEKNGLGNLALLDQFTNCSYGNSVFPIKRKQIISNDENGLFVPIATKNLFLKYYSKQLNSMRWTNQDAQDYLSKIEEILKPYLN
jgi:hypothetical protein